MDNINLSHRYWVFAFNEYYPYGGLGDIIFTSNSAIEAETHEEFYKRDYDFVYTFDQAARETNSE